MRVILISGDRHATESDRDRARWEPIVRGVLESFASGGKPGELLICIHGACGFNSDANTPGIMKGIDRIAHDVACELGYLVIPVPAHWTRDGKNAGPIRNREMVRRVLQFREEANAVVSCAGFHDQFSHSQGTRGCCEEAARNGIVTVALQSDGARKRILM